MVTASSFLREHLVPFFLVLFLLVDLVSLAFVIEQSEPINLYEFGDETLVGGGALSETEYIPKLSEIRGPAIDPRAVAIVVETTCTTLPVTLWVFLLIAYIALLIFNLAYDFGKSVKKGEHRFGWEIVLTVLALWAWSLWDTCGQMLWFPVAVIKYGLLTYVFYLYFFQYFLEKERRKFIPH